MYIYLFFFLFICFICVSIEALKLSHFGRFFWCLTHWNGIQFFKDIKENENFIRVLENNTCTLIKHIYTNHHFVQFMIHNDVNKKKEHPFTLKLWQAAASLQKYKRFDDLKYHLAGLQVYFWLTQSHVLGLQSEGTGLSVAASQPVLTGHCRLPGHPGLREQVVLEVLQLYMKIKIYTQLFKYRYIHMCSEELLRYNVHSAYKWSPFIKRVCVYTVK